MALAYLALAFLLGIAAAAITDEDPLVIIAAASLLATITAAIRFSVAEVFQPRRTPSAVGQGPRPDLRRTAILILLGTAAVIAGGIRYTSADDPDVSLAAYNAPPVPPEQCRGPGADDPGCDYTVHLRAIVSAEPDERETTVLYRLDVRGLSGDGTTWRHQPGAVLMRAPLFPRYEYGDLIEIEGTLEEPPVFPDFNYRDYLLSRGITSIVSYPHATVLDHGQASPLQAALIDVRRDIGDGLSDVLLEPHASLAAGILYGAKSRIPSDLKSDMQATGTSHLVAVSGQNITIVAAFVIALLAWIIGRRPAAWLSLVAIVAYTLLVGAQPSVIRAAIMGAVYVLATVSGRQNTSAFALVIAAAAMTAVDPRIVNDVSFQLSFAATLGLTTLSGPLRDRLLALLSRVSVAEVFQPRRTPSVVGQARVGQDRVGQGPRPDWGGVARPLAETLAVTLSAIAFTLPITAVNFGQVSLIAPIANLFVVPAFIAVAATSGLAVLLDAAGLTAIAAWIAYPPAEYMVRAVHLFATMPGASVTLRGVTVWHAATCYAALLAAAWWLARHPAPVLEPPRVITAPPERVEGPSSDRMPARRGGSLSKSHTSTAHGEVLEPRHLLPVPGLALLAALIAFAGWLALTDPSPDGRLAVTVLDVGQGDAILIEGPRGHRVLVDGGPGAEPIEQALSRHLPFDDRRIDLVVVSHPQIDHLTGLLAILQDYDVRAVLDSPMRADSTAYREWEAALDDSGVPVTTATHGQSIELGNGARLQVLAPDTADPLLPAYDLNEASTVLRLTMGDTAFLLTGDLDANGEANLIRTGADLHSTVLKIGHHGSATSTSRAFLSRVAPTIDVISVSAANHFGHPTQTVLDRLTGDVVLRTDEDGDVRFETDGETLWVER